MPQKPPCPHLPHAGICYVCRNGCLSEAECAAHLDATSPFLPSGKCRVCHFKVPPQWRNKHLSGLHHVTKLKSSNVERAVQENGSLGPSAKLRPYHVECRTCGFSMHHSKWIKHSSSSEHTNKARLASLQMAIGGSQRNKHPASVSPQELDFGLLDVDIGPTPNSKEFAVRAESGVLDVILLDVKFLSSRERACTSVFNFSIADSKGSINLPCRLAPQRNIIVVIKLSWPCQIGRFHDRLELSFSCPSGSGSQQLVITRPVRAIVGVREDHEFLKPKRPYVPKRRRYISREESVIPGIRPSHLEHVSLSLGTLMQWDVPKSLSELLVACRKPPAIIKAIKVSFLPQKLDPDTYKKWFHVLLYLEEEQHHIDIQRYNEDDAVLEPMLHTPYFRLEVPGLSEKRPSLIVGDRILVRKKEYNDDSPWYEGYVHKMDGKAVRLRFHKLFHEYKGQRYVVRFTVNRGPFKRMHQALAEDFGPERLFFPSLVHVLGRAPPSSRAIGELDPFNRSVLKNEAQRFAVAAILGQSAGSVPFVIFGPPGTGKTVTVVETIRQLLSQNTIRPRRILACAPSNSAADVIADRLMLLGATQVLRLIAPSRDPRLVPEELRDRKFVRLDSEGRIVLPTVGELLKASVIVCTCVSSFWIHALGIQRGHFSHIFIDEAGHAYESETIIPIKLLAGNATNIVLSGDPKQLCPFVRSGIARALGMAQSFLVRLMQREPYQSVSRGDDSQMKDAPNFDGSGITIVTLDKNFRSHHAIIDFPNKHFYGGRLQACAPKQITHSLLRSHVLRNPGFPVVFHSVTGKDLREASSPSFFNIEEVSIVKQYIRSLKGDKRLRLTDKDIGVISPYHAQCMKIGFALKNFAPDVKVGSVEEFQGQERRIILISTVRSTDDFIEHDVKHALGFVADARRFNVAVTRAQALLILIGDSRILALDPLWRQFLTYVHAGGGWTGNPIHWDPSESLHTKSAWEAHIQEHQRRVRRAMEAILKVPEIVGLDDTEDADAERPWEEDE